MRILALDLGTTTGWATYAGYPPPRYKLSSWQWGTWELKEKKEGPGEVGLRFYRFMLQLTPVLERWKPDLVAFEDLAHFKGAGGYVITGQRGILMALCELHKVPYAAVPISTWKKFCLGKGNADKDEAHRQLLDRWEECFGGCEVLPGKTVAQDAVDALWVGYYAVQNYTGDAGGQE